jgi:hypothetical protein
VITVAATPTVSKEWANPLLIGADAGVKKGTNSEFEVSTRGGTPLPKDEHRRRCVIFLDAACVRNMAATPIRSEERADPLLIRGGSILCSGLGWRIVLLLPRDRDRTEEGHDDDRVGLSVVLSRRCNGRLLFCSDLDLVEQEWLLSSE